ncbi:MAG TPA: hypothetical protein VFF36_09615, partial [Planctomycetota bacterium]|nr:hypothetical protein [Planctomycetota bacterium]
MKHLVPVLACVAVAACAAPPVQPPPATHFVPLSADAFPGASKVLIGFDERRSDAEWQPHDQVLFAVQFDKGGELVRWLLQLEAPVGHHVVFTPQHVDGEKDGEPLLGEIRKTTTLKGQAADGTPREWNVTTRVAGVPSA